MSVAQKITDQTTPHVLVIDDEAELCRMVAVCLRQSGFRTTTADSTADACNLLEQESFDAIVTDVIMPGEDGISFLGRVRQSMPEIPVILMTGYAQLQMAVNAIKNGAFDFVHKPFDFDHLRKTVERAVNYTKLQRMEKNYRAELEEMVASRTAELKEAVVELDFARSSLLKSAGKKNEFMANISHEMRTPMHGVIGGLSLLESEVTTANGREYLDITRQAADNMVALIDLLLTFGNGAGKGDGGAACCDLISIEAVFHALVAEYRPAFARKGLALNECIAPDVPREIWTNREHFDRLFSILLGNALKFTEQGGVTLGVSRMASKSEGEMLYFSVADSGIGIPDGMLEQIFEPFVQGDGSYTRRHGGLGLGLAIAQQNAAMLNGRLWAEHIPGGGSRFVFNMKFLTP